MGKTKREKQEDKLWEEKRSQSVYCKCTNRVPLRSFRNEDYGVCNWCGQRVYKDTNKQALYDFKQTIRKYHVYSFEDITFGEVLDQANKLVNINYDDKTITFKEA